MKTLKNIPLIATVILFAVTAQVAFSGVSKERKKNGQQTVLVIRGKVVDSETNAPLIFATVAVKETNVATVTNIDGEFQIKIVDLDKSKNLEFTYLGYKNSIIPLTQPDDSILQGDNS
jgi:hypothetical protein